ncbi:hydantoinase/oxoprolinase family protein [Pandoraea nosoerga]|uniref:Hydantoin utilization protein A n=1 Tax=Pandoraea nosoerga TaxID=2508296 RepID=A0A5E4X0G3_9BURK|nr:hydantoinase/oxoprolinase family protein [Pandoraea nosoerga]MBN4667029.1 hydantoinase/oxoprolinase family protein [Pandoraea nosoerga]MBN4676412.1 hydantoinase/oxoprolinase family protein [Pandoraea nosoerga]MBN4681450.1 hydantoinase/oxoprolinase family protein [Pandoraea nosoerga]MBN4746137.1 hydantoinase/oxoprolinase family protein [Pandoraea nosoerga]VVE29782.1 hydantoin utilization protein A [Pandoraea nosoerga]
MSAVAIPQSPLVVGVDVGGTFTDLFVLDEAAGVARIVKVPSTRGEEARGFMNGIERVDASGKGGAAAIATIVHGTTVGTNALLERKVARTGIITTAGFRDVLEMRRRDRPATWGLRGNFTPIVPRDLRLEVDERVLADGTVHTEVDIAQVEAAARALLEAGCEAVCVFFVNAYANPVNEQRAVAAVRALWPNGNVTAATEVLPEIREFERCSTATLNASLQPVVGGYLTRLARDLQAQGFGGELLVVQSNGGIMSRETASDVPVRTALSGPAAGVIACAAIARAAGFANVVTGDMGGTSFDVSLVAGGEASLSAQTSIEFGMVVRSPMIQIETIGAGGGSIASVDAGGLLQVGPESAGSVPGPACYGRGNSRPTVTDANVLLGRIAADRPLGGGLLAKLDASLAERAIGEHVAEPLGLDVHAAAEAILTVANAKMAGAIRVVSIERGHDPRQFAYMPFGGGGALHVCAMMREVGTTTGIVPRYPGVTSALGCVIADMRHDSVQTLNQPLAALDTDDLVARVEALGQACQQRLDSAGVRFDAVREVIELDMLYVGQSHTVRVPVAREALDREGIARAFETAYREAFGRALDGIAVRIMNLRYARIGVRPKFDLAVLAPQATEMPAPLGTQRVYHAGQWWDAVRHARLDLPVGAVVAGPAILEQSDTTIWLEPGFSGRVDALGNLLITRDA